jgi:hypothetical protein
MTVMMAGIRAGNVEGRLHILDAMYTNVFRHARPDVKATCTKNG